MPCASFPVEDKHLWCELKQKSKLSLVKKSVTRLSNQYTQQGNYCRTFLMHRQVNTDLYFIYRIQSEVILKTGRHRWYTH